MPLNATESANIYDGRAPTITADDLELYFASAEGGGIGIWRSTRSSSGEPLGAPEEVVELRDRDVQGYPGISPDGLELFYVLYTGNDDIVVAHRPDRQSDFSEPRVVDELRGGDNWDPELSSDGRTIVFSSNRDGEYDVWAATRDCLP